MVFVVCVSIEVVSDISNKCSNVATITQPRARPADSTRRRAAGAGAG